MRRYNDVAVEFGAIVDGPVLLLVAIDHCGELVDQFLPVSKDQTGSFVHVRACVRVNSHECAHMCCVCVCVQWNIPCKMERIFCDLHIHPSNEFSLVSIDCWLRQVAMERRNREKENRIDAILEKYQSVKIQNSQKMCGCHFGIAYYLCIRLHI